MGYVSEAQVKDRLSEAVYREIYDDDNDGAADASPAAQLIEDASSYVDEAIEPIYRDQLPLSEPYPRAIVRLTLDAVEFYAAKRHPEYVRRDWEKLKRVLDADLELLRKRMRSLGQAPPDPAANEGGTVRSGDPNYPTVVPRMFDGPGIDF